MSEDRYSRQSFLGEDSNKIIENTIIGVVGLGGGGSHIVQQLAHVGFKNFVLYDGDNIDKTNLNRLIGASTDDIKLKTAKTEIAERVIYNLQPDANIQPHKMRWQEDPIHLHKCDIIFGCVDGFAERRELEICARRYLIPYIDIGVDVHPSAGEAPNMSGQIILSLPGGPCLSCLNFLNENNLAKEHALYGAAGPHPQVVWANGVLASSAVGIAIDLLTGWTKLTKKYVYLSYDSNLAEIKPHIRTKFLDNSDCPHFPLNNIGKPILEDI